jgi:RNA polymerase sigma factor (sigma-70 family)
MSTLANFLRRERQALVGYVRRRLDDAADQDAEDVVQDVIVGLFSRPDPDVPVENLAAYIYQALRNRIVDRFRRRKETSELAETLAAPGNDPQTEMERAEMLDGIFEAMDELGAEEKAVILETEFEGKSFHRLAEEWDVPIGTLLARKSRALEKIRKRLAGRFDQS